VQGLTSAATPAGTRRIGRGAWAWAASAVRPGVAPRRLLLFGCCRRRGRQQARLLLLGGRGPPGCRLSSAAATPRLKVLCNGWQQVCLFLCIKVLHLLCMRAGGRAGGVLTSVMGVKAGSDSSAGQGAGCAER
jgi:hypothetical protein